MEKLFDLVSEQTKARMEALFAEQEKVVGDAVKEALDKLFKSEAMNEQIMDAMKKRMEGVIENYMEWRFEDADYESEDFAPLKNMMRNGLDHFLKTEKARKLAGDNIKGWIERFFEDENDDLADDFDDDLKELASDLYRRELEKIKENGMPELSKGIREQIAEKLGGEIEEKVDDDWEE